MKVNLLVLCFLAFLCSTCGKCVYEEEIPGTISVMRSCPRMEEKFTVLHGQTCKQLHFDDAPLVGEPTDLFDQPDECVFVRIESDKSTEADKPDDRRFTCNRFNHTGEVHLICQHSLVESQTRTQPPAAGRPCLMERTVWHDNKNALHNSVATMAGVVDVEGGSGLLCCPKPQLKQDEEDQQALQVEDKPVCAQIVDHKICQYDSQGGVATRLCTKDKDTEEIAVLMGLDDQELYRRIVDRAIATSGCRTKAKYINLSKFLAKPTLLCDYSQILLAHHASSNPLSGLPTTQLDVVDEYNAVGSSLGKPLTSRHLVGGKQPRLAVCTKINSLSDFGFAKAREFNKNNCILAAGYGKGEHLRDGLFARKIPLLTVETSEKPNFDDREERNHLKALTKEILILEKLASKKPHIVAMRRVTLETESRIVSSLVNWEDDSQYSLAYHVFKYDVVDILKHELSKCKTPKHRFLHLYSCNGDSPTGERIKLPREYETLRTLSSRTDDVFGLFVGTVDINDFFSSETSIHTIGCTVRESVSFYESLDFPVVRVPYRKWGTKF